MKIYLAILASIVVLAIFKLIGYLYISWWWVIFAPVLASILIVILLYVIFIITWNENDHTW